MDYKRTCWFCGKDTMDPVDTYFKCTSCGTTWVWQPELAAPGAVLVETGSVRLGTKEKRWKPRPIRR